MRRRALRTHLPALKVLRPVQPIDAEQVESQPEPAVALQPSTTAPPPPVETALLRCYVRVLRSLDRDGHAPLARHLANRLGRVYRKPPAEQLSRLAQVKGELCQALHVLELLEAASDQIHRNEVAAAELARDTVELAPLRGIAARSR